MQLPAYVDSDIGPIPSDGGDYLRFVKAFRRIVEAKTSVDLTITQLNALLQENRAYDIFAKLHAPDLATMWFMNALLAVPGVDPKSAQRLFAAGYRTIEELRVAHDTVLQDLLQIDSTALEKIRSFVKSDSQLGEGKAAV
jgi:ERCC4-type nuclease